MEDFTYKINNLDNQIVLLNKIDFKSIWNGKAANNLINEYKATIEKIKTEQKNITRFQEALNLIEECKKIDNEILRLKSLIVIPTKENTNSLIESQNASINSQIQANETKKQNLKQQIISIISSFGVSGNLSSIKLPSGVSGKIVYKYTYGAIYQFTTEKGLSYEAYIPNNYNETTPIMIYEAGDGRTNNEINNPQNWEVFKSKFAEEECNAIVLNSKRQNTIDYYNHLINECNLTNSKPITVSHSGGTIYALKETNDLIKQSSNSTPALVTIMDGYVPTDYIESQGIIQNFKDNQTIVLAFAQENDNSNYAKQYERLAEKGVNVLILYDNSSYGQSHSGVNTSFIKSNIMEYILGEGNLPDNYKIKSYDSINNKFIDVDLSQVSDIQSTYNYFGVKTSTTNNN